MYVSPQRRAVFRHLNFRKSSETVSFLRFSLANVRFATAACNFSTSQLQKVVRGWGVLYILTYKCTFRHSGVQFLNISTSKSGPNLRCFVHFDLQMYVSPQRRAVFRHLNFKKCSDRQFFKIFTCECAFRHSGVQFLLSLQNANLRTRRFNGPTFRPTWPTDHWKNTAFRDFSNISRVCIFFHRTFWLLHLLSTDLTALLLFNSPYCRKFLFKLPLTKYYASTTLYCKVRLQFYKVLRQYYSVLPTKYYSVLQST